MSSPLEPYGHYNDCESLLYNFTNLVKSLSAANELFFLHKALNRLIPNEGALV